MPIDVSQHPSAPAAHEERDEVWLRGVWFDVTLTLPLGIIVLAISFYNGWI